MAIWLVIFLAALSGFIGLLIGAAIGGGARADEDFQEYVREKKSEI